jgi:EAL domain-containing protein (putative c-di-GMP-specific phosphodiesterase class I)
VAQIVKSTIRLGQGIDMTIVAEGLQDENTLKMLRHFGCDLGQGYLFSQPLPLKEFTEWLKTSVWGIPHR